VDNDTLEKFVEAGAVLEHTRWAKWQAYVFEVATKNEDGTATIPKWAVDNWKRQISKHFDELTEYEKEFDKNEVRKYLSIIKKLF
jgi:hypothetical protein